MSHLLTVGLAQYSSGRDCMEIVAAAKAAAAEIVVFPEMYSNGYTCFDPNASPGLVLATFDLAAIRRTRDEERFRWQI
jgi:predicted amidohydrolase